MTMTASQFGAFRGGLTNRHIERLPFGSEGGPMAAYLWPQSREAVRLQTHFESTILTADWTVTKDTSCTDFVSTYGAGTHAAVGACDAADNQAISLIGANGLWCGDKNAGMLVILKSSLVASLNLEIGFVDVASDKTVPCVTDVDTPAVGNGAGDVAVFHLDTDQTLTTSAFVTEGSTASMVPTKTDLDTYVPTADTYFGVKIQTTGNAAFCEVFDPTKPGWPRLSYAAHGAAVASQFEGGVALKPYVLCRTRVASITTWSIDYIDVWQDM